MIHSDSIALRKMFFTKFSLEDITDIKWSDSTKTLLGINNSFVSFVFFCYCLLRESLLIRVPEMWGFTFLMGVSGLTNRWTHF